MNMEQARPMQSRHCVNRLVLVLSLFGVTATFGQAIDVLVQQANKGDAAAYAKILNAGMANYAFLKRGAPESEDVRARLRVDLRSRRDTAARAKGLVVHEWGASRFLQNADNKLIESAPEKNDDLPSWVRQWSVIPLAGHTELLVRPIICFYAERPVTLTVSLVSRTGILTQWWPDVTNVAPPRPPPGDLPVWRGGGRLSWLNTLINPFSDQELLAAPENSTWSAARDADAAVVTVNGSSEKFLYYGGVLRGLPLVNVDVADGAVKLKNTATYDIASLWVVSIRNGHMRHHVLSPMGAAETALLDVAVTDSDPLVSSAAPLMAFALREALEEAGLFPREAETLEGLWHEELFATDGLRIIYMRPRKRVDATVQLAISPAMPSLVRAFFTTIECMSPMGGQDVLGYIEQLASESFEAREAAQRALLQNAPLWRDVLEEARDSADDPEVQSRLEQILSPPDAR
ncbi:MAG: hypothetical protein ACI9OU_000737 [Candidatus Promineifilaceae bacterium]|jgi:hypothetical protein